MNKTEEKILAYVEKLMVKEKDKMMSGMKNNFYQAEEAYHDLKEHWANKTYVMVKISVRSIGGKLVVMNYKSFKSLAEAQEFINIDQKQHPVRVYDISFVEE